MMADERLYRVGVIEAGRGGSPEVVFHPDPSMSRGGKRGCGIDCMGCSGASLPRRLAVRHLAAVLGSGVESAAGDRLAVSIAASGLVRIATRAFGVPLAGLLGGAYLGDLIGGEWPSIASGMAGLALALEWIRRSGAGLVGLLELGAHTVPAPGFLDREPELTRHKLLMSEV